MIDVTVDVEQYDCPFVAATDDHPVAFSAVHWEYDTAAADGDADGGGGE